MPVKNIECQIAEMQIGRHVSGEKLSPEALQQLEAHLATCAACARVLADRRSALRSMLHQGYAAVTTDVSIPRKENLLLQALKERAETEATKAPRAAHVEASPQPSAETTDKKWVDPRTLLSGRAVNPANSLQTYKKPLLYSAALGVVLFLMGYLTHGHNSLMGDTAANQFPKAAGTSTPVAKSKLATPPATTPAKPATDTGSADAKETPAASTAAPSSTIPDSSSAAPATATTVGGEPVAEKKDASNSTASNTNSNSDDASGPRKAPALLRTHPRNRNHAAHNRRPEPARPRTHHREAPIRVIRPTNSIQVYDASGNPIKG